VAGAVEIGTLAVKAVDAALGWLGDPTCAYVERWARFARGAGKMLLTIFDT
jgi:hypothetical protein